MISEQSIEQQLPTLALQEVMEFAIDEIVGSSIYQAYESWHRGELPNHPDITVVINSDTLEAAVASADRHIIYIPADAEITQELTRRILERNPLNKRIIWEVHNG